MLEEITADFTEDEKFEEDKTIKIAIVGRPNAGKSSIVNALLGEKRVIVSDVSGTTRDSIDSRLTYENQEFVIIDTAGIRKKAKVDYGVEKFADRPCYPLDRECDVALMVIDATEAVNGISDQDKRLLQLLQKQARAW